MTFECIGCIVLSQLFFQAMKHKSSGGGRRPSRFRNNKKFSFKEKSIDVNKFVSKNSVKADKKEYVSLNSFADFELDTRLKRNVISKGYKTPTPIQDKAIPVILSGRDVVGIANTGTGKTAAFLLPLLHKVLNDRGQRVLILAPTRELAFQIEEEFHMFARDLGINAVLCIGGTNMNMQIRKLKKKYNFIIGTPGRVKDLLRRRLIDLEIFRTVVLDEADRMLDMGFIPDITFLLEQLPEKKHSLFFSATIGKQIEQLIQNFLNDPVKVSVKIREAADNVSQDVIRIRSNQNRVEVLQSFLHKDEFKKVLVFGRTKRGVDKLSRSLQSGGLRVDSIHGDKTQSRRQRALKDFKENRIKVLVATDVAARGLDIDNVSHVINFDLPGTQEDYIHRIGRTGRADKKGVALTFVNERY